MNTTTVWQTDDHCPLCGGLLWERIQDDGSVTQECGCGWYVTWAPDPDAGER